MLMESKNENRKSNIYFSIYSLELLFFIITNLNGGYLFISVLYNINFIFLPVLIGLNSRVAIKWFEILPSSLFT